jgi:hypothetical protein
VTDRLHDLALLHTGQGDQAMSHAQKVFAHNREVVAHEQVIVLVNAPRHRILDGDHAIIGFARNNRIENRLKTWTGYCLRRAKMFEHRLLAISAVLALEGNFHGELLFMYTGKQVNTYTGIHVHCKLKTDD